MKLANILGCAAIVSYVVTLLPSILRVVFPQVRQKPLVLWFTKHRRGVGISAFGWGLGHGLLIIQQRGLDLLNVRTYGHYFTGFTLLFILTLLSVTSLDWMRRQLKRLWLKIHRLTYALMILIPWHICHTMGVNLSPMTHVELWSMGAVIVLFLRRKQLEFSRPSKVKSLHPTEPEPAAMADR